MLVRDAEEAEIRCSFPGMNECDAVVYFGSANDDWMNGMFCLNQWKADNLEFDLLGDVDKVEKNGDKWLLDANTKRYRSWVCESEQVPNHSCRAYKSDKGVNCMEFSTSP